MLGNYENVIVFYILFKMYTELLIINREMKSQVNCFKIWDIFFSF